MAQTIHTRYSIIAAFAAAACLSLGAFAQQVQADPASVLRARYAALSEKLESSAIQKGVHVESIDSLDTPRGDAYAVVDYPFATVATAFTTPEVLCESLILHLNVHYCSANPDGSPALSLALGKKTQQPLKDTHRLDFEFQLERDGDDFLRVELTANEGPLGTSGYLLALELVALDDRRAFMHIRYTYTQSKLARMATRGYFATNGRAKVGFTRLADADGGSPELVRGIRGVIERNTMRYYLAFDAYLHSREAPAPQRFEASLDRWFAGTERFSLQLREVERDDYISMKLRQYQRQRSAM